ncbi:glycoside hydrolase family 2 [Pedobacter sp. HMWF019]|uniref:beta-galactosidase GalB n=1 Tax=Pedobacter sp. HMWF019 TaxID=2056856 RepID=UPI000D3AF841|nr:beta-galactosidase GalB [Pedobacter sp. HMWF019]PTT00261.1 glycoside hydrolase family 2 [Pedobacter sp. HMWF019]
MRIFKLLFLLIGFSGIAVSLPAQECPRITEDFNSDWKFNLGEQQKAYTVDYIDNNWRALNLPHDWSIEGTFSNDHPATVGGGALPGGIGWYRKKFTVPRSSKGKYMAIDFEGVYRNSEVWINGHFLGKRPNGYISFRYELSPFLNYGGQNIIAVRVDNSKQPNSRWYSGSGIYRNVKLLTLNPVHIDYCGTVVTTPDVDSLKATIKLEVNVKSPVKPPQQAVIEIRIFDHEQRLVGSYTQTAGLKKNTNVHAEIKLLNPRLWSDTSPYLYTVKTQVLLKGKVIDNYDTPLGIRTFSFDANRGFILNGKVLKIRGVCNHHDLGALGAAFNLRAAERQLEILKAMGCNGIRTSHNPPAPGLLDLCDKMGFIVMDEAFDLWAKKKTNFDYHLDWEKWHRKDLEDQIIRDRNHPSVFIWSIGNEIQEQWGTGADTTGRVIARELARFVRNLDTSRPVTTANNDVNLYNNLIQSGAMDLIGYNYNYEKWKDFHKTYPGKKLIATETVSALQTRGHYDMPFDSVRIWPVAWDKPLLTGNPDFSCSAYDNCYAPWGSSHEQTLMAFENNPAVSGMFVWTGFDYLGEPTPYVWPARSSYFGIIDLAGFPKDVYYLYKSIWTNTPVLHVFPHWNWHKGQLVDILVYYNQADEVELYLNGRSLGKKNKQGQDMKIAWKVKYEPGILRAVSRKDGKIVLEQTIKTAGKAAKLLLVADRNQIHSDGKDLSFVTVKVTDIEGNVIPDANQVISFKLDGDAYIEGLDNGSPTNHESFKSNVHSAFNGLVMAIIKAGNTSSKLKLTASSKGLESGTVEIVTR